MSAVRGGAVPDRVSVLLSYAYFDSDPRVSSLQFDLYVAVVSLVLYEHEAPLGRDAVDEAIGRHFPTDKLARSDLDEAIDISVELQIVLEDERGCRLSAERHQLLSEADARVEQQRSAFHAQMRDAVAHRIGCPLADDEARLLEDELERHVQTLFWDNSGTLALAFGEGDAGFDAAVGRLHTAALKRLVRAVAPQQEHLTRTQYRIGLKEGFLGLDSDSQAYLATLYLRTVVFALLRQDPAIRGHKGMLASRRIALLDTNVLMAWMFSAHPRHQEALEVVEIAKELGCELRVSKFTQDELAAQVEKAADTYRGLGGPDPSMEIVDDDILRTFHQRCQELPFLHWPAFIGNYSPPQAWLSDHGVVAKDEQWAATIHDERLETVELAVAAAKQRLRSPEWPPSPVVVRCDARNLLHVQRERKRMPADEMGNRVWLVTMDASLSDADATLVTEQVFRVPSSCTARQWVDKLAPCATPDSPNLQTYVAHLVKSRFGLLAEDPIFVDSRLLVTMRKSRIDARELVDGSVERVRQVLVEVQEYEEIARHLAGPDECDDDAVREDLEKAVRRALAEMDEAARPAAGAQALGREDARDAARRDHAEEMQRIGEVLERLQQLEEQTAALRREIDRRPRSWAVRLRRAFGGEASAARDDEHA